MDPLNEHSGERTFLCFCDENNIRLREKTKFCEKMQYFCERT